MRELAAPHYAHEFVFRALQWAIDHAPSAAIEAEALVLLQHLAKSAQAAGAGPLLPPEQVAEGFNRARERLPDIALDAPAAPSVLARLVAAAEEAGILPLGFVLSAPGVASGNGAGEGPGGATITT